MTCNYIATLLSNLNRAGWSQTLQLPVLNTLLSHSQQNHNDNPGNGLIQSLLHITWRERDKRYVAIKQQRKKKDIGVILIVRFS